MPIVNGVRYVDNLATAEPGDLPSPALVMLHGLGGSLEQWTQVQTRLRPNLRVVCVDIPGFGLSVRPPGRFDLAAAAAGVLGVVRHLDLETCVLVSHSIGVLVAAELAAVHPDLFSQVVVVSGTVGGVWAITRRPRLALASPRLALTGLIHLGLGVLPASDSARRLLFATRVGRQVVLWPFVDRPARADPAALVEGLRNSGSPTVLKLVRAAPTLDYEAILSAVRQPVTLVWGEGDRLISGRDVQRARELVQVVNERPIAGCGHWPWLEAPAEVADSILGAVDGTDRERR